MKKAAKETLRGIAGYILWGLERDAGAMAILANVGHDTGVLFDQLTGKPGARLASPRTRRYAVHAQYVAPKPDGEGVGPVHRCHPDDPCPVLVGAPCEGKYWRKRASVKRLRAALAVMTDYYVDPNTPPADDKERRVLALMRLAGY